MIPLHVAALDTETTGVDTKTAKVVELAIVGPKASMCTLVNPECPIPPETSAVHHICDDDVQESPTWEEVNEHAHEWAQANGIAILVAHNADYDRSIVGHPFDKYTWICTYKCALHVWPNAPSHKNEALRYWLCLGEQRGRSVQQATHSAKHDCNVTLLILEEMLRKGVTLDQMVAWTNDIKNLTKMPFGKHAGKTWREIDSGYLKWCINNLDDADIVELCKRELARRR